MDKVTKAHTNFMKSFEKLVRAKLEEQKKKDAPAMTLTILTILVGSTLRVCKKIGYSDETLKSIIKTLNNELKERLGFKK